MVRVYATPEQYAAYPGAPPVPPDVQITDLLARASEDIDDALLTALYPTDDDGMPTELAHVAALTAATCAQVEYRITSATGDDTGAADQWDSVSIGPVALSGRRGAILGDRVDAAPRAVRTLARAGLHTGRVCS
ncbi:hypothetical protein ACFQ61_02135 [Streptomyces sp. NPDC056500]|uniref:hypothetical protein n=1 Tax=Streptomyces sp. NPDC056500 TaxID=3345840 RepID=UPI00367EB377